MQNDKLYRDHFIIDMSGSFINDTTQSLCHVKHIHCRHYICFRDNNSLIHIPRLSRNGLKAISLNHDAIEYITDHSAGTKVRIQAH